MIFMQPQRLIVPLFQRPYVWNEEKQWQPLWDDVARVAERLLRDPYARHQPHFLGAVVVQQSANAVGSLQERTIIDGQQRLTTLQLLLDALHAELEAVQAVQAAQRLEPLVTNADAFCQRPEDQFKVWPTNRDRPAFNAVMGAPPPVKYDSLGYKGARLIGAHRFFAECARAWLTRQGAAEVQARGVALETAVREHVQMVVIDLAAEENGQEIFETLNARGTPLTPADLIKNFIFQQLVDEDTDVEQAYEAHWQEFETGFWEAEVNFGRAKHQRASLYLNQWLIARTGEEIVAREIFARFKRYAATETGLKMTDLLPQIHRASRPYREFVDAAARLNGPLDRVELFAYRTGVLESEVVKPLVIYLLDPEQEPVPDNQLTLALDTVESWLVRRMLIRATSKSYTQVFAELITTLRREGRDLAGETTRAFFRGQTGANWYWPDDAELSEELGTLSAYRRLSRARLRMVLEAIEDHLRGWRDGQIGLGGERVARGKYAIEHILPRKWQSHWPLPPGAGDERDRDAIVHTLGNLTLLTGPLNSKVSNGPWPEKREALHGHDVLLLNRDLLDNAENAWDEDGIRQRTDRLAKVVCDVWPVPEGHTSAFAQKPVRQHQRVGVIDLINAGFLDAGATLYGRRKAHSHRTATVLPDGAIDVDGTRHSTPSGAAHAITKNSVNGWWFFLTDPENRVCLRDLWREYVDSLNVDVDDEDIPEEEDD